MYINVTLALNRNALLTLSSLFFSWANSLPGSQAKNRTRCGRADTLYTPHPEEELEKSSEKNYLFFFVESLSQFLFFKILKFTTTT